MPQDKPFYDTLTDFMSSGPIFALELVADGAIQKWYSMPSLFDACALRHRAFQFALAPRNRNAQQTSAVLASFLRTRSPAANRFPLC